MYRTVPAQLLPLLLVVVVAACSSDDGDGNDGGGVTEGGVTQPDGGATDQAAADQTTVEPDQGVVDPKEFGRPCVVNTDPCTEPYICVQVVFGGGGFCSKECTNQGVPCNGAPTGTVAYCIIKDPTTEKLSCAFICAHPQLGNQKCPTGLKCSETDSGGGMKICEPE